MESLTINGNYSFTLDINGNELKVTYRRDAFKDYFDPTTPEEVIPDLVRFEFRGRTASSTGYKNHFTYLSALEDYANDPYVFAKAYAEYLYEEIKDDQPEIISNQLSLFD